jgi:hypothetical protein
MKKCLFTISLFVATSAWAREIRSPLLRDDPGYRLMPLPLSECKPWDLRAWAEPFATKADSAFCSNNCKSNCSDRCPLSTIIFGQPSFTGAQAFSPASVAASQTVFNGDGTNRTLTCTPLLTTSVLKPCLKFIDHGVMFALQAVRRVANCFSVGMRASIPYRSFKITHPCKNPPFGGTTLENLYTKPEIIDGIPVESYAYRLDVLSGLPIGCTYPQNLFPVVDYYNTLHLNNDITISNENVTDNNVLPINARNPISLIHVADGSTPQGQWALPLTTAQTLPPLPANGQTTDPRARFIDGTNYQPLGTDPVAQSELWVVPSVGGTDLVPAALVIRDNINELLETAFSTEQFFQNSCGDCFAPQRAHGIGDLQTEYFVRWQPNDIYYIEGLVGVRFPTGKRIENPKQLLLWPTGNNGHYEYRFGAHIGVQPCDYFMFNINSYYTYVAKREEQVIASYAGATVKNIGSPMVPASISWSYYLGHADAIFMQPCRNGILGIDIRYELYDKAHDHVTFKQCSAIDCLGNSSLLDSSVLQERTHVVSHTMRATTFYDTSAYTCDDKRVHWSLFAGYGAVVGGKNIAKEHGPYGGFMIIY